MDRNIGLVLEFTDEDVLAILAHMNDISAFNKTGENAKKFIEAQLKHDPQNVLYQSLVGQASHKSLDITPPYLIGASLKNGSDANNELLVKNSPTLKVRAVILIVRDAADDSFERTLDDLRISSEYQEVFAAMQSGKLPVIIVGGMHASLKQARGIFMQRFPDFREAKPYFFERMNDLSSKDTGNLNLAVRPFHSDGSTNGSRDKIIDEDNASANHATYTSGQNQVERIAIASNASVGLKSSEKVSNELNKLNSSIMIAIGGVSGAGKTTLMKYLLEKYPDYFTGLIETTTRPPRNDDLSGMFEYISESEFESRQQAGGMYFVTSLYGYRYGYYRRNLENALIKGKMLVCIMDEGVRFVRSLFPRVHVKRISIVPTMDIFNGDKLKKVEGMMIGRLQQRNPDMTFKEVKRRSRITPAMVKILESADQILVNDLSVDRHRMFKEMDLFFGSSLSSNPNPENSGGIDLNPAKLDLKTRNSGGEIAFNLDPAMLARLQKASGISPVIVSVRPLESLSAFMGIQKSGVR